MRVPSFGSRRPAGLDLKLPPASFDAGRTTGVKGVIADARAYENARRSKWRSRVHAARRSVFGLDSVTAAADHPPHQQHTGGSSSGADSEGSGAEEDRDEESFLQQWRESRRRELELEGFKALRTRRTSPSARMFGRFDEVDALGYLDAIEKVGRETVVVVFVYDQESIVSASVESALKPLVASHPAIHFVKVHHDDIEFDNAGVPAVLAYRNQGDLFANLTALIDMIPDSEELDSDCISRLLTKHGIF